MMEYQEPRNTEELERLMAEFLEAMQEAVEPLLDLPARWEKWWARQRRTAERERLRVLFLLYSWLPVVNEPVFLPP